MLQRGFLFIMKGLCRDQRVLTVCLFCKVTAARQHLPPSMLRLAKIKIGDDFSDICHFWANSQEISVVSHRPWSHSERKIIQKVRLRLTYQILSCFVLFGDSISKSNLCVDTNTVLLNTPQQPLCYFQCLTSNKICCSALGGLWLKTETHRLYRYQHWYRYRIPVVLVLAQYWKVTIPVVSIKTSKIFIHRDLKKEFQVITFNNNGLHLLRFHLY